MPTKEVDQTQDALFQIIDKKGKLPQNLTIDVMFQYALFLVNLSLSLLEVTLWSAVLQIKSFQHLQVSKEL